MGACFGMLLFLCGVWGVVGFGPIELLGLGLVGIRFFQGVVGVGELQ